VTPAPATTPAIRWAKEELVPIFIVGIVLLLYASEVVRQVDVPDHLVQLTLLVVTFYYGRHTTNRAIETVERSYAAMNGNGNGGAK
jgi:hypothetical protein